MTPASPTAPSARTYREYPVRSPRGIDSGVPLWIGTAPRRNKHRRGSCNSSTGWFVPHAVGRETDSLEETEDTGSDVPLAAIGAVSGDSRVPVVIVVPTLPETRKREDADIPRLIAGFMRLCPKHVTHRVH